MVTFNPNYGSLVSHETKGAFPSLTCALPVSSPSSSRTQIQGTLAHEPCPTLPLRFHPAGICALSHRAAAPISR